MTDSLRSLPRKVFDGFGYATAADSPYAEPTSVDTLRKLFARAHEEGVPLALRGSGRSYGDAATNRNGVVLDLRGMNRLLSFDEERGIIEAEPGFTIEDLWKTSMPRGYWPRVVSGTMSPTLGACAAMNIHGKNHRQLGGFGDALEDVDLLTPGGELMHLSREENAELFHAAVSGFGMLGVFTRLRLRLKRVHSGRLRVKQIPARNLIEQFELFESHQERTDYLVGWVDCIQKGSSLGRGQVHTADYLAEDEDTDASWLSPDRNVVPSTIMGVPTRLAGPVLGLVWSNPGMSFVNSTKYLASRFGSRKPYLQGHVAFHFLLDYVPAFRDAYRPGGFIQYQPFVPKDAAREVFGEILRRMQRAGIVSYLGVLKRYREDDFLLSHALDGYSLAMDIPVTRSNREAVWQLCGQLSDLVLEAGGKFYPAKDSVMRPQDFRRSYGEDNVARFEALRDELDPHRILRSDLSARVGLTDRPLAMRRA